MFRDVVQPLPAHGERLFVSARHCRASLGLPHPEERAIACVPARPVADSELREAMMAGMRAEPWIRTNLVNVTVAAGTADVWGIVDTSAEKKALRVLVETTPGVTAVNDNIIIRPVAKGVCAHFL